MYLACLVNRSIVYGCPINLKLIMGGCPLCSRSSLTNQMRTRADDLDVKLLLYAIQKTTSFEKTLGQRFSQSVYMAEVRWRGGGREGGEERDGGRGRERGRGGGGEGAGRERRRGMEGGAEVRERWRRGGGREGEEERDGGRGRGEGEVEEGRGQGGRRGEGGMEGRTGQEEERGKEERKMT